MKGSKWAEKEGRNHVRDEEMDGGMPVLILCVRAAAQCQVSACE